MEVEIEGRDIPMPMEPPASKGADVPAPKKPSSQRILDAPSPAATVPDTPSESPLPSPPTGGKEADLGARVGQGRCSKNIATPHIYEFSGLTYIHKLPPKNAMYNDIALLLHGCNHSHPCCIGNSVGKPKSLEEAKLLLAQPDP